MRTNEQINREICERGYITESEISLLKRRSNASGRDCFDYDILDNIEEVRVTPEQGAKGLAWLYKQTRKRVNKVTAQREDDIIKNASNTDFIFCGFYYDRGCFTPIYSINGMEYCVLRGELRILS